MVCLRYAAVDAAIQMCADKADDEAIAVAMDEEDNAVSVHLGAAGTARSYRRQTTRRF